MWSERAGRGRVGDSPDVILQLVSRGVWRAGRVDIGCAHVSCACAAPRLSLAYSVGKIPSSIMHRFQRMLGLAVFFVGAGAAAVAQPLAAGQPKFLGGIYSDAQRVNLTQYFNQVTPENAGKWGSVEGTRDVMNDTELRASYNLAKANGLPFRFHVLVWGSQQPAWMDSLTATEQLAEIEEWFDWVAANYGDVEYLEVVNEPINQPPDRAGRGNYINALGGAGATGWDWIIKAFEMARARFPASTKLMLNEYSVTTETWRMNEYIKIVNLLKERGLIDAVGVQGHSFSHDPAYTTPASTRANLDLLAATGVPIMVTEFDIDGPTDQAQLTRYQSYFPVFWEHEAVIGVTLWGYRPGLWRPTANLVNADGSERPAMAWLREYLKVDVPVVTPGQSFSVVQGWANGRAVGTVRSTGGAPGATAWSIVGGSGASVFAINASTGQLTLSNAGALNASATPSYTLNVRVSDGTNTSETATVTVKVLPEGSATTRLVALAARAAAGSGDQTLIMGFVVDGAKELLVQGVGPGIAATVPTALTDPRLELYRYQSQSASFSKEAENNDWVNSAPILEARARLGASALTVGSKDAALLQEVSGGVYTAHVTSGGAAGVALVEAYDADVGGSSRLMALSTRTVAGAGDATLIAGFVLDGSGPKTVLIRGLGPELALRGVQGVLADPKITVYRGSNVVETNDDWGGTQALKTAFTSVGAQQLASDASKDAALLVTLEPGAYTVHVTGAAGTTGVALVEIFDVP